MFNDSDNTIQTFNLLVLYSSRYCFWTAAIYMWLKYDLVIYQYYRLYFGWAYVLGILHWSVIRHQHNGLEVGKRLHRGFGISHELSSRRKRKWRLFDLERRSVSSWFPLFFIPALYLRNSNLTLSRISDLFIKCMREYYMYIYKVQFCTAFLKFKILWQLVLLFF